MIDINSNLQLHLKLNEIKANGSGGEIHDYSGHEKHAAVTGNPMVVADEHLGSCLLFNEGDFLLVEGLEGFEKPGPYTVAIWVKSATLSTWFLSKSRDEGFRWQLGAEELWVWENNPLSSISVGSDNLEPRKPINNDRWHHLAVTVDKNGNMTAYQDGAYAGSYQGNQPQDFGATGQLRIGTQEFTDTKFTAKLAHLRIYSGCLSSDEIQECIIYADKTALAAFRTTHPIEFNLVNKETHDPVLYITDPVLYNTSDDKASATAKKDTQTLLLEVTNTSDTADNNASATAKKDTQTLLLEVTNTSDTDFTFGNTDSLNADKEHYHFQLQFRPNTLSASAIDLLSQKDSLLKAQAWAQGWDIHYDPDKDDLVDWISLLRIGLNDGIGRISSCMGRHTEDAKFTDALDKQLEDAKERMKLPADKYPDLIMPAKSTVSLELTGISAGASGGTRATRVYLHYQNLELSGQDIPTKILPGSRSQTLEIINRLGKERIPLHFGFIGSNSILNDGNGSELMLRITNLTNEPLSLYTGDPESKPKFRLSFDYQDRSHTSDDESGRWERHWAIGETGVAGSINIIPTEDDQEGWKVTGAYDLQEPRPFWLIEPTGSNIAFKKAETVEFVISNIKTTAPTGMTNLYVEYKNIPGYWDGEFVLPIKKGPLVHRTHSFPSSGDHPDGKPTLQFDGDNDFIEVADFSIPNQGTIEAWIYLDEDGEYPDGWRGIAGFDDNDFLALFLYDGKLNLRYSVRPGNGFGQNHIPLNEGVPRGQWVHVAGTWDQYDGARLYVNGVEKGASSGVFQAKDTDNTLRIGFFNGKFKGRIARVSLWNWSLNAESIKKHMDLALEGGSLSSGDEQLIGYWPLDSSKSAPDVARPPYHPGVIKGSPVLVLPKDEGFTNTGIGTDKPQAKLHVSVATENRMGNDEDKEPAAIFEGGKVGIGTNKPKADLDVAGDVDVSGDIYANYVFAEKMEVRNQLLIDRMIADGKVMAGSLEVNGLVEADDLKVSGAITGALHGSNINNKSITLDKLVEAVQLALCPVGTILPFAGDKEKEPNGWLMCRGTLYEPTTYPNLFDVIGYRFGGSTRNNIHFFRVPDLRGYFLRGMDGDAGRDPDRASRTASYPEGATGDNVGSVQEDAFRSHRHNYTKLQTRSGGTYKSDGDGKLVNPSEVPGVSNDPDPAGGNETRPMNMYVNYIIKY